MIKRKIKQVNYFSLGLGAEEFLIKLGISIKFIPVI